MGGACGMSKDMRNKYKVLVVNPEGKRKFERTSSRWNNITCMSTRRGVDGFVWTGIETTAGLL
jgi:hypothetical protein